MRVTISQLRSNFTRTRSSSNFSTFITLEECNNKLQALKAQDEQKVTLQHCNADAYNPCSLQFTLLAQQLIDETAQKTAADWKDKAQVSSRCLLACLAGCQNVFLCVSLDSSLSQNVCQFGSQALQWIPDWLS